MSSATTTDFSNLTLDTTTTQFSNLTLDKTTHFSNLTLDTTTNLSNLTLDTTTHFSNLTLDTTTHFSNLTLDTTTHFRNLTLDTTTTHFSNLTLDTTALKTLSSAATTGIMTKTTLQPTFPPCGLPPTVAAATSMVVRDVAKYTCVYGYKMSGIANDMSCINGTWRGTLPSCVYQGNDILLSNHEENNIFLSNHPTTYNENEKTPFWSLLILGTVGVLAAVLLLCCMILLCLKLIGCKAHNKQWYIPCCARPTESSEIHARQPISVYSERPQTLNTATQSYFQENEVVPGSSVPQGYFAKLDRQKKPAKKSYFQDNEVVPGSSPPQGYFAKLDRQKKPAKKVVNWMPHKNRIRTINTSTQ